MPSSLDMCFGSANKLAMCASSRGRLTGSDKSAELEASKAGIIQCSRVSWPVRSMEHNLVMKEFRQLRKLAASRGSASILIIARSLFLYTFTFFIHYGRTDSETPTAVRGAIGRRAR